MAARPRKVGRGSAGRASASALPTVLLVAADEDERAMLRDALIEGSGPFDLRMVESAAELERYLVAGADADAPAPSLVLVDVAGHATDAIEAIERLKRDPEHHRVPVIVLADAGEHGDDDAVAQAYDAGANTVLPRPATFLALVRLMKVFTAYWLDAATLPAEHEPA